MTIHVPELPGHTLVSTWNDGVGYWAFEPPIRERIGTRKSDGQPITVNIVGRGHKSHQVLPRMIERARAALTSTA